MMRFVRPRVLLGISSLAVLAVLAAGCGGGGGGSSNTESTQDWADGVCSAINTWSDSLKSASASVSGGNLSENSLTQAATDLKDATAQLKDDLSGLGKPDVNSGDKAKESIDTLSGNIQDDVDKIEGAIKGAQSGGGIASALTTVTSTISTMGSQVQSTFSELENLDPKGELEDAFKNASSCKSLTSQQG
jgi:HPt (histidine-containing phosphotransfer) domain-containing protein